MSLRVSVRVCTRACDWACAARPSTCTQYRHTSRAEPAPVRFGAPCVGFDTCCAAVSLRFMGGVLNMIDLVAIVPFYVELFVSMVLSFLPRFFRLSFPPIYSPCSLQPCQ